MGAKNITSEKMNTAGFQSGGYNGGPAAGKHTPKKAIIDANEQDSASPKRGGTASASKNTSAYKR